MRGDITINERTHSDLPSLHVVIISRFLSGILRSRLDAEPAAALTIPEGRRGDLIRIDRLASADGSQRR